MRRRLKLFILGLIGLLGCLLFSGLPGWAQQSVDPTAILDEWVPPSVQTPAPVAAVATAPGVGDPQELASFIDQFMANEMLSEQIPGAAIAIVKNDEILFSKGYGYADLEEKVPVDADRTLFRVASLSKLFTATAAMQLHEQGAIDVHDDITPYLGERVTLDNPFEEPVTFARIMMHTEGSTKRRIGLAARTEQAIQPLEDYLADHLPPIIYPPGKLYSYSSHAIALLGYLVQRIAGQPFEEYIEQNILQPLEMRHSSFRQPPPPPLEPHLAKGYQAQGKQLKALPYLYLNIAPAASFSSTATDMAHFMIAHLQSGAYQDQRILQPETVDLMHTTHFAPHPSLPGTGYSFRERLVNNIRTIGHLGSLRGYSSSLTLVPEHHLGIFVASNIFSGIHEKLLAQFFDHYFPVPATDSEASPIKGAEADLRRFTGTYWDLEYPHHTWLKISAPFKRLKITQTDSGLQIEHPAPFFLKQLPPTPLEPVAPLLFRRVGEEALVAFEADANGNIRYAYNPIFPKLGTYQKVAWYQTVWVQIAILGISVLVWLSAIYIWPVRPGLRRLQGKTYDQSRSHSRIWLLAGLTSSLNLAFLVALPLSLWLYGAWKLAYGMPWFAIAAFCLPLLATVLAIALALISGWAWLRSIVTWPQRLYLTLVALTCLGFLGLLAYWNVLGFQF